MAWEWRSRPVASPFAVTPCPLYRLHRESSLLAVRFYPPPVFLWVSSAPLRLCGEDLFLQP